MENQTSSYTIIYVVFITIIFATLSVYANHPIDIATNGFTSRITILLFIVIGVGGIIGSTIYPDNYLILYTILLALITLCHVTLIRGENMGVAFIMIIAAIVATVFIAAYTFRQNLHTKGWYKCIPTITYTLVGIYLVLMAFLLTIFMVI